jgi:hypothetical protein
MITQPPEAAKRREEVPAEVSKRGVMIVIEGALSSRRKRAGLILCNRPGKKQGKSASLSKKGQRRR